MPKVLAVLGSPEEGLLEFAEALAGELESRGRRVGLVQRGAVETGGPTCRLVLDADGLAVRRRASETGLGTGVDQLAGRYGQGLDILLTTAHPEAKRPKIEFCPPGRLPRHLDDPALRVVVCDQAEAGGKPCFAPGDLAGLADFVERELAPAGPRAHTTVLLDGRRVPIKAFVQDIIAGTIRAMIRSLKGGDRPGRLEIFID